ncbi:MAG: UPF0179 family protein [Candidatus Methanoplasma sp.]|jgi:uncharacterized protein (UPF0179 family)|nr:UPF0179 family protein [Candidatus Methanoplasma sp.]
MVLITLVSETQAEKGGRFYYLGPQPECLECKLKGVCLNLLQGSLYEIEGVRPQTHGCALNEDKVRAVEVRRVPIDAVIPKRSAIEGSIITFRPYDCGRIGCVNYTRCHLIGTEGGKYSVDEVIGDTECPAGKKVASVRIL